MRTGSATWALDVAGRGGLPPDGVDLVDLVDIAGIALAAGAPGRFAPL